MSEIKKSISFPLDEDGFFRRECPLCHKEFKVLLKKEELTDLAQEGMDSFMLEEDKKETNLTDSGSSGTEFFCPYCGQQSPSDSWWTQEQLNYIAIVARNIIAKLLNESLIRPLKRTSQRGSTGMFSLRFESKEIKQQNPWISPEINDMEIFDLPCCQRKIKIEENWRDTVYCFFCGFPYECENRKMNDK